MVRHSVARAAGLCLALLLPFGARAAMLAEPDSQPQPQGGFLAAARDLSAGWLVAPTGTSGGSQLPETSTWSLTASPPGPDPRPLASFEPKAIVGFSTWDLGSSPSELLQQTDSPVPLPSAFWSLASGALVLVLWSRRHAAGTARPNEGRAS